ncbi:hypothetical protein DL95DRAFT_468057 [Leptodontidium sp. 2 PMI_412]|nr:hypothetical protein DL95DRAFT_468057 [Leptodontidium sp. 2 PMI_412]
MIGKWEFQFVEAMRHVFSELRVSGVGSTASNASTLTAFKLDYSEARKLPPSSSARATMGELFRHIWPLHLSVVNGGEPVSHDLGLYDYTIFKVMQGTSLDSLHHLPLRSSMTEQHTLDIYDHESAPVLTTAIKYGGDNKLRRLNHIILHYWQREQSTGPQFPPHQLRLHSGD